MASRIAACVLLGIVAGLFSSWAAKRYGQAEKGYLVAGAFTLGGILLILFYQRQTHRWQYLSGDYLVSLYATQWIAKLMTKKA